MIATLVVVAAFFGMLWWGAAGSTRVQCELCIAFNGRDECRVGQGADRETAIESARTNACAVMTGGVTDAFRCNATEPQSLSCKAL